MVVLFVLVPLYATAAADWTLAVFTDRGSTEIDSWDPSRAALLAQIGCLVAGVLFIRFMGGTPAKVALGLRVVLPDGSRPGLGRACLRMLIWTPILIPGQGFEAGVLISLVLGTTIAIDDHERSLADRIAGTQVCRKSEMTSQN